MKKRVSRGYQPVKVKAPTIILLVAMIIAVIAIIVVQFLSFSKERISVVESYGNAVSVTPSNEPSDLPSEAGSDLSSEESSKESSEAQEPFLFDDCVVPKTKKVDGSYFENALFIGDSISQGLKLYGVIPEKNVIADQNAGLDQIAANKDVYYVSATEKTNLWDAIDKKGFTPEKIYILLGANGIPGLENDKHIPYYYDLIGKLKEKFPNAIIYVESVTPITKATSDKRTPSFTKEKILGFNELVLKMAKDEDIYYLNIQETLADENGYLLPDYDAGDGTHMPKAGHQAVYEYLKEHAVQADGYVELAE